MSNGQDGGGVHRETRGAADSETQLARLGELVGTPALLATLVVVLVTTVGLVSTASSYWALRRAGRERAEDWLKARTARLTASFGNALGIADELLDELAPHVVGHRPGDPIEPLLDELYSLSTARPGLTWMSVSYPDGTFVGVYRDETGELRAQESRVTKEGGRERKLVRDRVGALHEVTLRPTDYDPRTRSFFRLASAGKRAWTNPYPFLPNLNTGVSRVQPLYTELDGQRSLAAVLTVDFDASELTKLVSERLLPSQRIAVVTADGALLASAGVALPPLSMRSRERPLTWHELDDRVVAAMREAFRADVASDTQSLNIGGETYHADRAELLSLDGAKVTMFSAVPESELYAGASAQARKGAWATAVSALFGIGLALVLSSHIARLRRKRAEAQAEAIRAREEANELGSYELIAPLGAGAMGEVYRARHKLLARDAALKLMKARGEDLQAQRARFFDEARRLASMRSVHTVAVYDFGVAADGRYFLAMELLDGLDLEALVRRHGKQPPGRVAAILAQICDSLAEAHDAQLVHQDIKPANVFLCRVAEALDVVKVLDFGLSRIVGGRADGEHEVEGTPAFMAPEQVLGEPVDIRADLYAVGGVGYFLLTGKPPYEVSDIHALMLAHVEAPVPALPPDVLHETPPLLAQLLSRCLAKRPEHRPVSARILASALRGLSTECAETFSDAQRAQFWAEHTASAASADAISAHAATVAQRMYAQARGT